MKRTGNNAVVASRKHQFYERVELQSLTDLWPILCRVEELITDRGHEMHVAIEVKDSGGTTEFDTIAEMLAEQGRSRHVVEEAKLQARREDDPGESLIVAGWALDTSMGYLAVHVWGAGEAETLGLGRILVDEIKAGWPAVGKFEPPNVIDGRLTPGPPVASTPVKAGRKVGQMVGKLVNHDYTVAIVSGLIVTAFGVWLAVRLTG